MPSASEDFQTLKTAIKSNALDEVKKMLRRDDAKALLQRKDLSKRTALMHSCFDDENTSDAHKVMSLDMIKLLFAEIRRIGGNKFLKEQLTLIEHGGWHCLMLVSRYSPSHGIIQYVIDTILEVGGHGFLRALLEVRSTNISAIVKTSRLMVANPSITSESLLLLCSLLFEFGLFKKQHDELAAINKQILKKHGIDASWTPGKHGDDLLRTHPENATAYFKSLLLCAPVCALSQIESKSLLTDGNHSLNQLCSLKALLAIEKLSSQTLVTICAMLLKRDIFKTQYATLDDNHKAQLANQGIKNADWSPENTINELLESDDPHQALHQVNLLCKYTSKPPLDFLNDKVLHSEEFLNIFAAPSFVNYLNKLKLEGSLSIEFHRVYKKLDRKMDEKIDLIEEDQEPSGRSQVFQENLDNARSLRQHAFQEGAIRVCESTIKTSFTEFQKLFFDFCEKKLDIERDEQSREWNRIGIQQVSLLAHQELSNSLSIKRTHFINKSANTLRRKSANILKTAPLRRVTEKHKIALAESDIQNLSNHNIMGGGKFDINILDGFLLDEMKVPQDSRTAILNLVRLHRNEAFVRMEKRFLDMEKRSSLQATLFSLQQEKSSLIMKLRESPEKTRWIDSINHSMKIQTATLDDLEQAVNDLEDEILDLTQLVDHEKTSSPRSADNSGHAQTLAHDGNNDDDDEEIEDDFSQKSLPSDEQSKYAARVNKELVKYRPSSSTETKSFKSLESDEV